MPETLQSPCIDRRTDPTINVTNMLHEAIKRQDDLRGADVRYNDKQFISISDMFVVVGKKFDEVDVKYQIQFSAAEKAIGIAQLAQEKLTAQALDGTKEAISKNDANTEKRFTLLGEKIDDIASLMSKNTGSQGIYVTHTDLTNSLERLQENIETMIRPVISYMNNQIGKGSVEDPIQKELLKEVKALRDSNATAKGTTKGMGDMWGWIVAVGAVLLAILGYLK